MRQVETNDFNALTDNAPIFDQLVKNKQVALEKLLPMSRNDDWTTRNLLDFSYHQNYYKFVGIDSSRQTNTSISQQINFVKKIRRIWCYNNVFIAEKWEKNQNFYLNLLSQNYTKNGTWKNAKLIEWSKRF